MLDTGGRDGMCLHPAQVQQKPQCAHCREMMRKSERNLSRIATGPRENLPYLHAWPEQTCAHVQKPTSCQVTENHTIFVMLSANRKAAEECPPEQTAEGPGERKVREGRRCGPWRPPEPC